MHCVHFIKDKQINPRGLHSSFVIAVPCGPGTYLTTRGGQCHFCPRNHYQDMERQTACKPCPAGQHTRGEGAFSVHQCLGEADSDVNTALTGNLLLAL